MYEYNAKVERIVDGDTLIVDVDLGFSMTTSQTLRLYGINAPEVVGENKAQGLASKEYLSTLLPPKCDVFIKTHKDKKEKFGRYLAEIFYIDTDSTFVDVNKLLVDKGYAVYKTYE